MSEISYLSAGAEKIFLPKKKTLARPRRRRLSLGAPAPVAGFATLSRELGWWFSAGTGGDDDLDVAVAGNVVFQKASAPMYPLFTERLMSWEGSTASITNETTVMVTTVTAAATAKRSMARHPNLLVCSPSSSSSALAMIYFMLLIFLHLSLPLRVNNGSEEEDVCTYANPSAFHLRGSS